MPVVSTLVTISAKCVSVHVATVVFPGNVRGVGSVVTSSRLLIQVRMIMIFRLQVLPRMTSISRYSSGMPLARRHATPIWRVVTPELSRSPEK